MSGLWGRVEVRGDDPVCRATGVPVRDVVAALEEGQAPARAAAALGLDAADLVAALGHAGLGEADDGGPGLVQGRPARPGLAGALAEPAWAGLLPGASRPARLALAAGLLQIHDFWDASHEAAQEADDLGERASSAYWHGIAHRREPDSGNASYWFRRVGRHPVMAGLAEAARPLVLAGGEPGLADRLAPRGGWDPSAFLALCNDGRPGPGVAKLARSLQRLEMILLLEATAAAAGLA
jgi:uncharacterized protein (DUF433 family)